MAYKPFEDNDKIPFGKHKGTRMIDLPISYLVWALDVADEGTLKDYAIANQKWIRAEAATGKYNRPVRVAAESTAKVEKPQPPNLMTASEFIRKELSISIEDDIAIDGIPISQIARLAERYKNYFNGTPNLKPLPKIDNTKKTTMMGWGDEPQPTKAWKDGDDINDLPF